MKKYFLLLILFICAALQMMAESQIAIYVVGDASDSYKKVVASALTQAVNNDGHFQAVERTGDFLSALGNEVSYQNSGAVSQSKIIELGRQFGAQYVFVVDLNNVLGELYASSRIINAEKNIVEAASDESSRVSNLAQLRMLAKQISTTTLAKLPYNVEKEQRAERNRYLQKQREIWNEYTVNQIVSIGDFYSYYRDYSNLSKDTALKYIQACKDLGIKLVYPVYYASILERKSEIWKFRKSGKRQTVYIRVYFINEYGKAMTSIEKIVIDPTINHGAEYRARSGSYLHR